MTNKNYIKFASNTTYKLFNLYPRHKCLQMKGSEMALVFLKPQNRHNTARALYSDIDTEENKQTGREVNQTVWMFKQHTILASIFALRTNKYSFSEHVILHGFVIFVICTKCAFKY